MASKIWDLAREAVAVRLQLAAVNATDWQLTPKAYYADALSVAGASDDLQADTGLQTELCTATCSPLH